MHLINSPSKGRRVRTGVDSGGGLLVIFEQLGRMQSSYLSASLRLGHKN